MEKITRLVNYLATYPQATIRFQASNMILHIESDAAYLVFPGARSRYAGHFYLSNQIPSSNGPIHTECRTIQNVVCSAAEAECAGLFGNCQLGIQIRRILTGLGHLQPPTTVVTDNSTATAFVNTTMKTKKV